MFNNVVVTREYVYKVHIAARSDPYYCARSLLDNTYVYKQVLRRKKRKKYAIDHIIDQEKTSFKIFLFSYFFSI